MSRLEKHCLFCMANSCQSAHAARHIKEGLVCFGPWQNRKKTGSDKGGWELYCENPRSQDILLQKETPHTERNKDVLRAFPPLGVYYQQALA